MGFATAACFHNPFIAMAGLTLALAGLKSALGPFWTMGTTFLRGTAAAGGIAFINSVGNLGGYVGPKLVGFIKGHTDNNVIVLLVLGGALLSMGLLALLIPKTKSATVTGT